MKTLAIIFTVPFLLQWFPYDAAKQTAGPAKLPAKKFDYKMHLSLLAKQPSTINNLLFTDEEGRKHPLIDSTKKVNMIVFWASWCGPCRMEIPDLKTIFAKTDASKVRLISISVDKDKAAWLKAVKEENMPWPQLLAEGDNLASIKKDFGFTGIPQIYFLDSKGRVLDSYTGFHYDHNIQLTAIVERLGEK